MKKVFSLLSVLAVVSLMTLTSCSKTEGTDTFKVTFSEDNTYVKAEVKTSSITYWSFAAWADSDLKDAGFSDPINQKYDVISTALKDPKSSSITRLQGSTDPGEFAALDKLAIKTMKGPGTFYAYCWSYKYNTTDQADVVTVYKFTLK